MRVAIDKIFENIQTAKTTFGSELEQYFAEKRKRFGYTLKRGKAVFERNIKNRLRLERVRTWQYILRANPLYILSAPVIYGMIVPIALLDLTISLYQHVCFRVYKISRVKRSEYIRIDRHRLPYLNSVQKLNCMYCGYGNGVIAYAREIIARTEQFWCPIKHVRKAKGEHSRVKRFLDYGDAQAYKTELIHLRNELRGDGNT